MDNKRRQQLLEVCNLLTKSENLLETVRDKEDDCLSNTPENLRESERAHNMEDAIDILSDVIGQLSEIKTQIHIAIEGTK